MMKKVRQQLLKQMVIAMGILNGNFDVAIANTHKC